MVWAACQHALAVVVCCASDMMRPCHAGRAAYPRL